MVGSDAQSYLGVPSGALGANTSSNKVSSPIQTIAGGVGWSNVAIGYQAVAATKTDGTLWTWGNNGSPGANQGQLGDNSQINRSSPVQIGAAGTWYQPAFGTSFAACIRQDGTLWLWGYNYYGSLAQNNRTSRSSPVQIINAGNNWIQVSCGLRNALGLKSDGTLWSWGNNSFGGLGINTATTSLSSPVQVVGAATTWRRIASGYYHSAAIKSDGTLWCWGRNSYGQLGDNTTTNRSSPVQVVTLTSDWSQVQCGYNFTAAIKKDGSMWLWGQNSSGQLGDNTTISKSSPVQTLASTLDWGKLINLSHRSSSTGAIKKDGSVYVWGANTFTGLLGTNDTANKSSPVQIMNDRNMFITGMMGDAVSGFIG